MRMRSGHCHVPTHLHRIGVQASSLCMCGEEGTLNHLFFACPEYSNFRVDLMDTLNSLHLPQPYNIATLMLITPVIVKAISQFLNACSMKL